MSEKGGGETYSWEEDEEKLGGRVKPPPLGSSTALIQEHPGDGNSFLKPNRLFHRLF